MIIVKKINHSVSQIQTTFQAAWRILLWPVPLKNKIGGRGGRGRGPKLVIWLGVHIFISFFVWISTKKIL